MTDTTNRGFASMDEDKQQRDIASQGGQSQGQQSGQGTNDRDKTGRTGQQGQQKDQDTTGL